MKSVMRVGAHHGLLVPGRDIPCRSAPGTITVRLVGTVPAESWNRVGTRLVPKLRASGAVRADVQLSVTVEARLAGGLEAELRQALEDLGLWGQVRIERA